MIQQPTTGPTDEQLAEWLRLAEAATPGRWLNAGWDKDRGQTVVAGKHQLSVCQCYGLTPAFAPHEGSMSHNAAFIAAARLGFPATIRALQEARRENERLRDACRAAIPKLSEADDYAKSKAEAALAEPKGASDG